MRAPQTLAGFGDLHADACAAALEACDCGSVECPSCGPEMDAAELLSMAGGLQRQVRTLQHAVAHLLVLQSRGEQLDFVRGLAERGVMRLPAGITQQPRKEFSPALAAMRPDRADLFDAAADRVIVTHRDSHVHLCRLLGSLSALTAEPDPTTTAALRVLHPED